MLMIAGIGLLAGLVLLLVPVVLVLGATVLLFGLLLILATFVAWALWASWAFAGIEVSNYVMPGAVMLGVLGLLAVRMKDRLQRR